VLHSQINRRRFERYSVSPMYTPVAVRFMQDEKFTQSGHAYDISEGGIQFELDRPIDPGTPIAIEIALPYLADDIGPGRSVFVLGNVIWADVSEPGPCRLAMAFTRFARAGDRERLMKRLVTMRMSRAA
jgi:hypothetical protein